MLKQNKMPFRLASDKSLSLLENFLFSMVEKRPCEMTEVAMRMREGGFSYEGSLSNGIKQCDQQKRLLIIEDGRNDKTIKFLIRKDKKGNVEYYGRNPRFVVGWVARIGQKFKKIWCGFVRTKRAPQEINRIQKVGFGHIKSWRFKSESIGFGFVLDDETGESFFFDTWGILDERLKLGPT